MRSTQIASHFGIFLHSQPVFAKVVYCHYNIPVLHLSYVMGLHNVNNNKFTSHYKSLHVRFGGY